MTTSPICASESVGRFNEPGWVDVSREQTIALSLAFAAEEAKGGLTDPNKLSKLSVTIQGMGSLIRVEFHDQGAMERTSAYSVNTNLKVARDVDTNAARYGSMDSKNLRGDDAKAIVVVFEGLRNGTLSKPPQVDLDTKPFTLSEKFSPPDASNPYTALYIVTLISGTVRSRPNPAFPPQWPYVWRTYSLHPATYKVSVYPPV